MTTFVNNYKLLREEAARAINDIRLVQGLSWYKLHEPNATNKADIKADTSADNNL